MRCWRGPSRGRSRNPFLRPSTRPLDSALDSAVAGGSRRAAIFRLRPRRALALGGLSLAAAALVVLFLPGPSGPGLEVGTVARGSSLYDHLQTMASGRTVPLGQGRELTILATLPVDGGHCREVEVIDRAEARLDIALACTSGAGWRVEVVLGEPLPATVRDQGFVPAGGMETEPLAPWLDRLGAGVALASEAEAATIARGWTR